MNKLFIPSDLYKSRCNFTLKIKYERVTDVQILWTTQKLQQYPFSQIVNNGLKVSEDIITKAFLAEFMPQKTYPEYITQSWMVEAYYKAGMPLNTMSDQTKWEVPKEFFIDVCRNMSIVVSETKIIMKIQLSNFVFMTSGNKNFMTVKSLLSLHPKRKTKSQETHPALFCFVDDEYSYELRDIDITAVLSELVSFGKQLFSAHSGNYTFMTYAEELMFFLSFPSSESKCKDADYPVIQLDVDADIAKIITQSATGSSRSDSSSIKQFKLSESTMEKTIDYLFDLQEMRVASTMVRLRSDNIEDCFPCLKQISRFLPLQAFNYTEAAKCIELSIDKPAGKIVKNPFEEIEETAEGSQQIGFFRINKSILKFIEQGYSPVGVAVLFNNMIDDYNNSRTTVSEVSIKKSALTELQQKSFSYIDMDTMPQEIFTEICNKLNKLVLDLQNIIEDQSWYPVHKTKYSFLKTLSKCQEEHLNHVAYCPRSIPNEKWLWSLRHNGRLNKYIVYESTKILMATPTGKNTYDEYGNVYKKSMRYMSVKLREHDPRKKKISKYLQEGYYPMEPDKNTPYMSNISDHILPKDLVLNIPITINNKSFFYKINLAEEQYVTIDSHEYRMPGYEIMKWTHLVKVELPGKKHVCWYYISPSSPIYTTLCIEDEFDERSKEAFESMNPLKIILKPDRELHKQIMTKFSALTPPQNIKKQFQFEGQQLTKSCYYTSKDKILVVNVDVDYEEPKHPLPWISKIVYTKGVLYKYSPVPMKYGEIMRTYPSPGCKYDRSKNMYWMASTPLALDIMHHHKPSGTDKMPESIVIDGRKYVKKYYNLYICELNYYFIMKPTREMIVKRNEYTKKIGYWDIINNITKDNKYEPERLPWLIGKLDGLNIIGIPHSIIQTGLYLMLDFCYGMETVLGEHSALTQETMNPRDLALITTFNPTGCGVRPSDTETLDKLEKTGPRVVFVEHEEYKNKYCVEYEIKTSANEHRALANFASKGYHVLMKPLIGSPSGLKTLGIPLEATEVSDTIVAEYQNRFSNKESYRGLLSYDFIKETYMSYITSNCIHVTYNEVEQKNYILDFSNWKAETDNIMKYEIFQNGWRFENIFNPTDEEVKNCLNQNEKIYYYSTEEERRRIKRELFEAGSDDWMNLFLPATIENVKFDFEVNKVEQEHTIQTSDIVAALEASSLLTRAVSTTISIPSKYMTESQNETLSTKEFAVANESERTMKHNIEFALMINQPSQKHKTELVADSLLDLEKFKQDVVEASKNGRKTLASYRKWTDDDFVNVYGKDNPFGEKTIQMYELLQEVYDRKLPFSVEGIEDDIFNLEEYESDFKLSDNNLYLSYIVMEPEDVNEEDILSLYM